MTDSPFTAVWAEDQSQPSTPSFSLHSSHRSPGGTAVIRICSRRRWWPSRRETCWAVWLVRLCRLSVGVCRYQPARARVSCPAFRNRCTFGPPGPGEVRAREGRAGEVQAGEIRAGEVRAGEIRAGEIRAGELRRRGSRR